MVPDYRAVVVVLAVVVDGVDLFAESVKLRNYELTFESSREQANARIDRAEIEGGGEHGEGAAVHDTVQ